MYTGAYLVVGACLVHYRYCTVLMNTCSYVICRQELSQMNHDLEARLAQLQTENLQSSEQLTLLTQQLSTAQQEAQLANRLLEETRTKLQDSQKQHQENVSLGHMLIWKASLVRETIPVPVIGCTMYMCTCVNFTKCRTTLGAWH